MAQHFRKTSGTWNQLCNKNEQQASKSDSAEEARIAALRADIAYTFNAGDINLPHNQESLLKVVDHHVTKYDGQRSQEPIHGYSARDIIVLEPIDRPTNANNGYLKQQNNTKDNSSK